MKDLMCDFFHETNRPQQGHHFSHHARNPAFLGPLQDLKSILNQVELKLQRISTIPAPNGYESTPTDNAALSLPTTMH